MPRAEIPEGRYEEKRVTPGFDDEVGYLERVTVTDRAEAIQLYTQEWGVAENEVDPQPIHMRFVIDDPDPVIVPELPCWLECKADHPDAVPFWKDAP